MAPRAVQALRELLVAARRVSDRVTGYQPDGWQEER
jgi:hypothetical protein